MKALKITGHLVSVVLLLSAAYSISILEWIIRKLVDLIQNLTGADIPRDKVQLHTQREKSSKISYEYNKPENGVVDEKVTLSTKKFPISKEELIAKTKKLISPEAEFGSKNPDLLADDFQFVFPVVGPLSKIEFCTIFGSFKVKDAFPDTQSNFFGFTVDPLEPNRVWFFTRATMTHTGSLKFGRKEFKPTGKEVVITPQCLSMSFDKEGRCYKFTGGYSIDRTTGNCGGLGGLFGIIHSIGAALPFPEAKPWKPSLEWEAFSKRIPEIGKVWES